MVKNKLEIGRGEKEKHQLQIYFF